MQILKMFSRAEAEDEAEIELSFQELLQSSPYICIALGALSACLTFAVLISMYIPADRFGYPNVCAGKRKMVTERACQTGGWCDRSSLTRGVRLRKLRSTSYGPRQYQGKVEVYTGEGIQEYPSSELFPVKYKSNRVSDIGSANIVHNVCDCFPESAHHHKLASIMSSKRNHPQLSMHSALGELNQRHKYLAGKRLPQGSLAHARDIKYPVQTAHGKMSHAAGNLPKEYKYLKHNDSYLTMTNPTLSKSQRQRSASRPPSNRISVIPPSITVLSPEVNTARWLCCFGNQDPSNQLDNNGEDGSKRKYSSDTIGNDKRKRKNPHRQRSKKTSCQNKLNRSGVTNHAENYSMLHERNADGASWKNCAMFCGLTLASGKANKPLASASSSNNVSSRIFNSEASSNDQSQSRSLADISSDGESFPFLYAEQQSHSDLPGVTASSRLGKDRMLPSQKLSKPGIFTSLPPEVRKPPCGHSKEHKPRNSRRQRKRRYVMQTDDVWETDDFSCSEQFGNSANALLCTSPGEAGENTRSSMVEPGRRTQEATTNQRITYRQCSAAREFHQKVPTFTLNAAGPEDRHAKISSNQECGQGYREGCLQEKSIINQSSHTEASSSTLVKLDNCSDELRSLMKATIMDLQKYKCSQLTVISEFQSLVEELPTGSRVETEHYFSRTQSRSKHFGNLKGKDNLNSYPQNCTDCRDQNCTNEFNRSHQFLQDNSEPFFAGNTSLGRRAGNDQLFLRAQSRGRHVGGQAEQEYSMCHAQDTSIKDCSCNSKFSRSNQMNEDKSVQIHNTLTGAEATETSIVISSLRQKKQKMAQLADTSKEKSEDSGQHSTVTKAEITVRNTAKQPRRQGKQRKRHKEDTLREEFLSEQCFGQGLEHIVTMKDQDIQYNCSGNFFTNINYEDPESRLGYNDDMTESESKLEKGSQIKQSLGRPKSRLIHQEGSGKLERSELQKFPPIRRRERADKCSIMQNCESYTVTTCCNKQVIELTPNKNALNKRLATNNNRLQHENIIGTTTMAPSHELIIAFSDSVGMSKECQHGFNCVGASEDIDIRRGKREQKDMSRKCQAQTSRGGQHSSRSVVGECKSVGDDVSSSDCVPHLSDVSLMTNNSAECADVSKQMTLTYSHKSKSTEIQDNQTTYILKGRKTRKDTTTGVNSTIDSQLLTYSPDCVQNCTSSQLEDKSNEINSKKQDKLSKDTLPLHCEEAAVDRCSGSSDLCLNANEYSIAAPATSSQFQIQPCQHHSSMLEIHDRNVSHKSEAIYGLQDISHPSRQRERRQGRHRRKKLHKTTTKSNDKRTYKQKTDGIDHRDFRGKETLPGINNYQGKPLALWNRHRSDTFRSTNKHLRPKEKYLMSKTCKLNITGNRKCSKMVFLRSLPQTSSECSLVSNSHITVTSGQIYGTQISSSSHSRSSSQSIYVAQLITNSSSFDLSGNTYSLQDAVVIKTDSVCRCGYQLSASTSVATECSRTYEDTSCYPIQYTYRGNSLLSGGKKTVEQVNDASASTLHGMLNMETLPYHLPAHTEYGMGASNWSSTTTTVSNEISLTSSDGSDLSIYCECASTQSLLVQQIQNIFQNVKSAKEALQPESVQLNFGKYVSGKQKHSNGTAQLSDSCDDECCCGTAHIPDSCTTEHSYGTMQLPKIYKSKFSFGKMQSPASRQLKCSCGSVQPRDNYSFEHSSGTVQALDSPKYSFVKIGASISSSPELRSRAVESLGSSSSVDNSGTVQVRGRCNPEASSMLLHDQDMFSNKHSYRTMGALAFSSHKHRAEIMEPLVSSSHKHIYKKPQALTRSNTRPHHRSSHIPDNYLSHHCKPSSKIRQQTSTHKRKPLSSPLSPPSIPLNGERVSYMQITSKNGAFKGLRLSEMDQRSFSRILKKSHSKSNPIIYVSGDNNLTVERQPFSPSVSHPPLFGSRSSVSAASASHSPISERCVWTRSRLAGGDSQRQQDILVQQGPGDSQREQNILVQQLGPGELGSPDLGPTIHGDRHVIKNSHRKSSSTKPTIYRFDPHNNIIKKSTQQTDFAKISKCKKKVTENQIPSYNSASFQTIYKVSTPNKMLKHKIKTKQGQRPHNKQKSKLPILCSKNTKSENRHPPKNHNFEKIRKKVYKTSENLQKASFLSNKCQKMSVKKKRSELTTRKSCKPVELKRSAVKNEIHNLDNLFTKDFILRPNNVCRPCLPSNHKYKQTVQQVNVCPKTTHMQSLITTQNPRRHNFLQKNIYKPNAYYGELNTAERSQISIHQKPKAHEYDVFSSDHKPVAKNNKSEFNSESCSGKNTQINVYLKSKTCNDEPSIAENIPDSKVCRSNSKKRELLNSGCKQRHVNRETEECNSESSTSEDSQTSIHRRRKTKIDQPYIAGNMQNSKAYKAQGNKREVLKAKYKQVGKNREGGEYNGVLNTVENTETSSHHKHGVHRWQLNNENERVSKTFKPRVYNGEPFTGKNSQIRKYPNPETPNDESHKAKIMKISKTQKRCPNKYMTENTKVLNSNYKNLCKLGTLATAQSVGESKDSKTCIDTPSPKVFKGLAVSTVKNAKSKMAESPPFLNNLDHKRKSDGKELTKDQLEDTTSTFSRNPPGRVFRKSISCKPEAVFKHKRSRSLVQSAYKIRQLYTGLHAEEDDDSMVGVTATSSPHCEVNRTGLEQQVKNTWLKQVRKPEQSEKQKMNNRNIWQRQGHRKVLSKTLKENVYPLENTSPAGPSSCLQKTSRSLDICSPAGQSDVNTVIPTERSLNVSHGLLCSQLRHNTSKTTKDTCFQQKSSLNSPEKYNRTRDLEEIPRQGGAESSGETLTRNLSGSLSTCRAGRNKRLKEDPCRPCKQVSALDVNHDTTNPLSVFSVSRQAHDNARPVRIRRLHKTAPAANDMGEKAAAGFVDIRKNPGNYSFKPRNTIRRVTGKFNNEVPHNNKDVKPRGRNRVQDKTSEVFSSKMCETSPSSSRYQQNRCSSKFVHEDEEVLAAPDSATKQPCKHTSVKRVQFGNHKHDHLSTANKRPSSQYGNRWRRQEIELTNSLRKGKKGFQIVEQLKPEKHCIVDEPIPNPILAQVSSSPELQNAADESLPVTEGDNVLDRNVSAEEKTRHRIQTRNNIPKDWNCTNKTIGYDSSNKILRQEKLMSPIDEMDFLNVTCDTTSHTNSHQNIARASTFKRPNVPQGALRDMALNNSTKNLHFMSKCLDVNSDLNTEDSVFPNTTDDVSASAIFDHNSPIAIIIHKHRTCFQRNDSVNSCLQNRKQKTRTQSTNQ